jgi:hypothetical protein
MDVVLHKLKTKSQISHRSIAFFSHLPLDHARITLLHNSATILTQVLIQTTMMLFRTDENSAISLFLVKDECQLLLCVKRKKMQV